MEEQFNEEKLNHLREKARDIRVSIIEMLAEAGSGHLAGSLGMADIFSLLYFHTLKHDPQKPDWEGRDRLVLSNGHICPVLYAALAESGYFPIEELKTLRKFGSRLQGHPHREFLPMLETSSGPLGEGLSQAVGMALAFRLNRRTNRVYCVLGDGEQDEGQVWEAALLAGKEKLDNLIAIIDRNSIQLSGKTEDILPLEPLKAKWESFGWQAEEANGHDFRIMNAFLEQAAKGSEKPTVIIARTIPGKGVPEIEGKFEWHGKAPTKEEVERFIKSIRSNE